VNLMPRNAVRIGCHEPRDGSQSGLSLRQLHACLSRSRVRPCRGWFITHGRHDVRPALRGVPQCDERGWRA
jgi:hypothetical protein